MDEKLTHDEEHDSKTSPVQDCPYCQREVLRRTRRCFGDGYSSLPVKPRQQEDEA